MEWEKVQDRLNKIIQTDVMVDEEWDFMATHMPFKRLSVQFSGRASASAVEMSEEDIYRDMVYNPNDEHRMIIVRGPNGAGKSHLIRWMRSRLRSDNRVDEMKKEKIVFIRRIDNTLRGAVRQLLEQDIIRDPEQKERMLTFIQSSDVQSEGELKSSIYYNFVAKIENEEKESSYKDAERKRLVAFLLDTTVKNFLMREDGPITRFYELIVRPKISAQATEATFNINDFISMRTIMSDVQRNSNADTKRVLVEVKEPKGAEKLAAYLNRFAHAVIRTCANITLGDADEMIRQLRLDLKREGRALTILIEDMTTFTSMDSELIKILTVQHGGEYKDLCRVTSIIGITDAYYDAHFRGNFQNRVTHQINVDSNAFGSEETLAQMAARYINAAYMFDKEAIVWYNSGAEASKLPYRTWEPDFNWETVDVNGSPFSLFPFTRRALSGLFDRLQEKTPRFFIKDVLRSQMNAWVSFQENDGVFPNLSTSAVGEQPIQFLETQHIARFEMLDLPDKEKVRLRALLCIWGDGRLYESGDGENKIIGSLPIKYLQLLGFNGLSGIQSGTSTKTSTKKTPNNDKTPPPNDESPKRSKQYQNDLDDIESWYQNKTILSNSEDARKRIYEFVIDAINWQMEGVPAYLVNTRLNTRNIFIEGQRQKSGDRESSIIAIDRNIEGYWLLLALTHWGHNKPNWDFEDSAFMQYKLISWLENNKKGIISRVKGEPDTNPSEVLEYSMALEYIRLGMMGNLSYTENDETLIKKLFLRIATNNSRSDAGDAWGRFLKKISNRSEALNKNKELLIAMPNTHMGSVSRQGEMRKFLYHRDDINDAFKALKRIDWDATSLLPTDTIENDELITNAVKQLQNFLPGVKEVLIDERRKAAELLEQLKNEFGDDLSKNTWINASRDMVAFLDSYNSNYGGFYTGGLREKASKIEENSTLLARICKRAAEVAVGDKFSLELAFFSSDPCQILKDALDTIKEVEKIATNAAEKADKELANLRDIATDNSVCNTLKEGLIKLIDQIGMIGGGSNA